MQYTIILDQKKLSIAKLLRVIILCSKIRNATRGEKEHLLHVIIWVTADDGKYDTSIGVHGTFRKLG